MFMKKILFYAKYRSIKRYWNELLFVGGEIHGMFMNISIFFMHWCIKNNLKWIVVCGRYQHVILALNWSSPFSAFPWLLIPALSLVSLAGLVLLITNLQVANLFGEHRYTVMATFIGAYHACSVIMTCMKVNYKSSISLVCTWKSSFAIFL